MISARFLAVEERIKFADLHREQHERTARYGRSRSHARSRNHNHRCGWDDGREHSARRTSSARMAVDAGRGRSAIGVPRCWCSRGRRGSKSKRWVRLRGKVVSSLRRHCSSQQTDLEACRPAGHFRQAASHDLHARRCSHRGAEQYARGPGRPPSRRRPASGVADGCPDALLPRDTAHQPVSARPIRGAGHCCAG